MAGNARIFLVAGGASAALAVVLGAFGAHALRGSLDAGMLAVYQTASQYHLVHSLGLLAVGLLAARVAPRPSIGWAGWLMLAGLVLFSGSLYLLAVTGAGWLGGITPAGGIAFVAAWICFCVAAARSTL
ncbi:MAG: DUF423 domain-containing protein [Gammaproteobacteria bacterium]|nr:DUF423 domain-containing protein [Gammaproteobacteria bacterium]